MPTDCEAVRHLQRTVRMKIWFPLLVAVLVATYIFLLVMVVQA